jgi:hypothetical protein
MLSRLGYALSSQSTKPQPEEDALLRGDVVSYRPAPSTYGHANSTNVIDLASGLRAFHKPFEGVNDRLAKLYGHEVLSVGLNECAAWVLAKRLGPPYSGLVAPTVLRWQPADALSRLSSPKPASGWGPLVLEHPGRSLDLAPLSIPKLNDAVAFFDALIAQQDRHAGQFRWDPSAKRLGLIDHGFAFAVPGQRLNDSIFLAQRHAQRRERLQASESAALRRLVNEPRVRAVTQMLAPAQGAALINRAKVMLSSGILIRPGDW